MMRNNTEGSKEREKKGGGWDRGRGHPHILSDGENYAEGPEEWFFSAPVLFTFNNRRDRRSEWVCRHLVLLRWEGSIAEDRGGSLSPLILFTSLSWRMKKFITRDQMRYTSFATAFLVYFLCCHDGWRVCRVTKWDSPLLLLSFFDLSEKKKVLH